MDVDHPDAFLDLEIQPHPAIEDPTHPPGDWLHCPVCKGHGMWNLVLNEYPDMEVPQDRHFKQICGQCHGWGWVRRNTPDATCIHEYVEMSQAKCREAGIHHFGRCYHVYRCPKCGTVYAVDSSG